MKTDWIDLSIDLATLRERPMPSSTRALQLEAAIVRVERAQHDVRSAVSEADEDLARTHLALAAGHLAKVTKLHPGLPTWKPPKLKSAKKKPKKHPPPTPPEPVDTHLVYQRSEYRGHDERRFVGDLRRGQETRQYGARRPLEVRNLTGGKGTLVEVEGAPIVYGVPYFVRDAFGEFTEAMQRGVAAHLIDTADCRFLFGHDGLPLARTKSGTMKLADTASALRFTATLDRRQQLANDLVIAIERGDVSSMSIGMVVAEDQWSDDMTRRTISRIDSLLDVSAVVYPASPSTSIALAAAGGRV